MSLWKNHGPTFIIILLPSLIISLILFLHYNKHKPKPKSKDKRKNPLLNKDCEGHWSKCTKACESSQMRTWVTTVTPSGNGKACPKQEEAPDCQYDEDACTDLEPNIRNLNCQGYWTPCTSDCELAHERRWVTMVEPSGGRECPLYPATNCKYGEGGCLSKDTPLDCKGEWSECNEDCERSFKITRESKYGGKSCDLVKQQTLLETCSPGEDECPLQNNPIDCEGEWSECNEDCERTFNIRTQPQYSGRECPTVDPNPTCQDGEERCQFTPIDCIGHWSDCNSDCDREYIIDQESRYGGESCDKSSKPQCQPNEGECREDVEMCEGYWEPCSEDCETTRRWVTSLYEKEKGKECPNKFIEPEKCTDGVDKCVFDDSYCKNPSNTSECIFYEESGTCSRNWINSNSEECSNLNCEISECDISEDYCLENSKCVYNQELKKCERVWIGEGIKCNLEDFECDSCEYEPIDCEVEWSDCNKDCERTRKIIQEPLNGGQECETIVPDCEAGEGSCPQNLDCKGQWICDSNCESIWKTIQEPSGNGRSCDEIKKERKVCLFGEDQCKQTVDYCNNHSKCDNNCNRTWDNTGLECDTYSNCVTGQDDCGEMCEGLWSDCSERCEKGDQREWISRRYPKEDGVECPSRDNPIDCVIEDCLKENPNYCRENSKCIYNDNEKDQGCVMEWIGSGVKCDDYCTTSDCKIPGQHELFKGVSLENPLQIAYSQMSVYGMGGPGRNLEGDCFNDKGEKIEDGFKTREDLQKYPLTYPAGHPYYNSGGWGKIEQEDWNVYVESVATPLSKYEFADMKNKVLVISTPTEANSPTIISIDSSISVKGIIVRHGGILLIQSKGSKVIIETQFILIESGGLFQAGSSFGYRLPSLEKTRTFEIRLQTENGGHSKMGNVASQYSYKVYSPGVKKSYELNSKFKDGNFDDYTGNDVDNLFTDFTGTQKPFVNAFGAKCIATGFNGNLHLAGAISSEDTYTGTWRINDWMSETDVMTMGADTNKHNIETKYPNVWSPLIENADKGGTELRIDSNSLEEWKPGYQVLITCQTNEYTNELNKIGLVPIWMDHKDGKSELNKDGTCSNTEDVKYSNECGNLDANKDYLDRIVSDNLIDTMVKQDAVDNIMAKYGIAKPEKWDEYDEIKSKNGHKSKREYVKPYLKNVLKNEFNNGVEIATIKEVKGNVITLERELKFNHIVKSKILERDKGDTTKISINLQLHVGLLTRNILITSDFNLESSSSGCNNWYWDGPSNKNPGEFRGPGGSVLCNFEKPIGDPDANRNKEVAKACFQPFLKALLEDDVSVWESMFNDEVKNDLEYGCEKGNTLPSNDNVIGHWIFGTHGRRGSNAIHGGHCMFRYGSSVRIDGVEILRMGTPANFGTIGRYPLHFHLNGYAKSFTEYLPPNSQTQILNNSTFSSDTVRFTRESSVFNCSIYPSFNRWVVIHGSHEVDVKNNVSFISYGSGYFSEDGTESFNTFEHNMGVYTLPCRRDPYYNPEELTIIPNVASDYCWPSTIWYKSDNNRALRNILCNSPTPVIGLWAVPQDIAKLRGPSTVCIGDEDLQLPALASVGNVLIQSNQGDPMSYMNQFNKKVKKCWAPDNFYSRLAYTGKNGCRVLSITNQSIPYLCWTENVFYNIAGAFCEFPDSHFEIFGTHCDAFVMNGGTSKEKFQVYMPINGQNGCTDSGQIARALYFQTQWGGPENDTSITNYPYEPISREKLKELDEESNTNIMNCKKSSVIPKIFTNNLTFNLGPTIDQLMMASGWTKEAPTFLINNCFLAEGGGYYVGDKKYDKPRTSSAFVFMSGDDTNMYPNVYYVIYNHITDGALCLPPNPTIFGGNKTFISNEAVPFFPEYTAFGKKYDGQKLTKPAVNNYYFVDGIDSSVISNNFWNSTNSACWNGDTPAERACSPNIRLFDKVKDKRKWSIKFIKMRSGNEPIFELEQDFSNTRKYPYLCRDGDEDGNSGLFMAEHVEESIRQQSDIYHLANPQWDNVVINPMVGIFLTEYSRQIGDSICDTLNKIQPCNVFEVYESSDVDNPQYNFKVGIQGKCEGLEQRMLDYSQLNDSIRDRQKKEEGIIMNAQDCSDRLDDTECKGFRSLKDFKCHSISSSQPNFECLVECGQCEKEHRGSFFDDRCLNGGEGCIGGGKETTCCRYEPDKYKDDEWKERFQNGCPPA